MIEVSRDQVAELRKCAASTVSRAHLPKTEGGKYDLTNSEVWTYVISPDVEKRAQEIRSAFTVDHEENGAEGEKLRQEILLKKEQVVREKLRNAKTQKELIPIDFITIWIGMFTSGIRNNFLQLGNRIARGNKKLRDRIEAEVEKAIKKTLENAEAQLRQESEKIIESMEEER